MRWIGLLVVLVAIPLLRALILGDQRFRRAAWFALGFLPYVLSTWHLEVSIISWAYWPGYSKGAIVSVLDAVALALIFSTRSHRLGYPFAPLFSLYFASMALSAVFSDVWMASTFVAFQVLRALIVMLAVAKCCTNPIAPRFVISGLASGIAFQAFYALNQRLLHGVTQATGTMGHQNLLGMISHFALLLSLAMLLSGRRSAMAWLGVFAGLIVVVLTGSRATVAFAAGGFVALLLLSTVRRPTGLKLKLLAFGAVAGLVATPVALKTLASRYQIDSVESSDAERAAFKRAAWAIWADHRMGIGANQYVVVSNSQGYSERAGVNWNSSSRATNVHNAYLLLLSETGFLGVGSLIALFAATLLAGLRFAWTKRRDPRGELALGATVTIGVIAAHCAYEWIFVESVVQYLLAINIGLLAGVIRGRRYDLRKLRLQRRHQALAQVSKEASPSEVSDTDFALMRV